MSPSQPRVHLPAKCARQASRYVGQVSLAIHLLSLTFGCSCSSVASRSRSPGGSQPNHDDHVELPFPSVVFTREGSLPSSSNGPFSSSSSAPYNSAIDPSLEIALSAPVNDPAAVASDTPATLVLPIAPGSAPSEVLPRFDGADTTQFWEGGLPMRQLADSGVRSQSENPLGLLAEASSEIGSIRMSSYTLIGLPTSRIELTRRRREPHDRRLVHFIGLSTDKRNCTLECPAVDPVLSSAG
jgi:hypothetical protein